MFIALRKDFIFVVDISPYIPLAGIYLRTCPQRYKIHCSIFFV